MSNKLKIVHILPKFKISGGVERIVSDLSSHQKSLGHEVHIISAASDDIPILYRYGIVHHEVPLDRKGLFNLLSSRRKIKKIFRDIKPDIVHIHSRFPALVANKVCQKLKIPFVTTVHSAHAMNGSLKKKYNDQMHKGHRIIVASNYMKNHVMAHYDIDENKLVKIPFGINIKKFNPDNIPVGRIVELQQKWSIPLGVPIIALPGRITAIKGHELLIKVLSEIPHRNFCCLFIGGASTPKELSYQRYLEKLIMSNNLYHNVRITGNCDIMEVAYMFCDAVICPSLRPEGFGLVVLEAMAMGRPIAVARHGAMPELLENDFRAWKFTPNNVESLAKTLDVMLSLNVTERETIARGSVEVARTKYSNENMALKHLELYSQVIAETN